jgi:hypothetical protein
MKGYRTYRRRCHFLTLSVDFRKVSCGSEIEDRPKDVEILSEKSIRYAVLS